MRGAAHFVRQLLWLLEPHFDSRIVPAWLSAQIPAGDQWQQCLLVLITGNIYQAVAWMLEQVIAVAFWTELSALALDPGRLIGDSEKCDVGLSGVHALRGSVYLPHLLLPALSLSSMRASSSSGCARHGRRLRGGAVDRDCFTSCFFVGHCGICRRRRGPCSSSSVARSETERTSWCGTWLRPITAVH